MLHGTPVLYTEMSPNCGNTEVDIAQKQLHMKDEQPCIQVPTHIPSKR
jgi:hypothetical protein